MKQLLLFLFYVLEYSAVKEEHQTQITNNFDWRRKHSHHNESVIFKPREYQHKACRIDTTQLTSQETCTRAIIIS